MRGFTLKKGDSTFLFVLSAVNSLLFASWSIAYIVCIFLRNAAFTTAQTNMALTGQAIYTVEISSPFFAVLKAFVFMLPVIMGLWTVLLYISEHKGKELCDSKLVYCAFGADAFAAILCALDITAIHMIF